MGKPKAQPIAVCHPDQKYFVQSLVEKAEEEDRVGPKALHPWRYPPVFLVDTHHPSLVDSPGGEPHWTEKVEDKEKWNGVVFRWVLYVGAKIGGPETSQLDSFQNHPYLPYPN